MPAEQGVEDAIHRHHIGFAGEQEGETVHMPTADFRFAKNLPPSLKGATRPRNAFVPE